MDLLELRQRIREDLAGYDTSWLKKVYLELTRIDQQLTGFVNFSDLGLAFNRCEVR